MIWIEANLTEQQSVDISDVEGVNRVCGFVQVQNEKKLQRASWKTGDNVLMDQLLKTLK